MKKLEVGSWKLELTCRRFIPTSNFQLPTSYAAIALFLANSASACPVCFGDPSAPTTKGMNAAIWFLLGMVGLVQVGFVALFVTFWRRARELRRRRDSMQLIHGGLR